MVLAGGRTAGTRSVAQTMATFGWRRGRGLHEPRVGVGGCPRRRHGVRARREALVPADCVSTWGDEPDARASPGMAVGIQEGRCRWCSRGPEYGWECVGVGCPDYNSGRDRRAGRWAGSYPQSRKHRRFCDRGRNGCAIDETKALHCWGFNSLGQVGDGTQIDRPEPVRVETLSNVTSVGGSSHAMYARTGDGRLYSWGYNSDYSLGINSDEMVWRTVPGPVLTNAGTAVTDAVRLAKSEPFHYWSCAVVSNVSLGLRCWGHEFGAGATSLSGATSVSSVAVGDSHGCYATTDKRARCWGRGQEGQLGHGSQPIVRVTSPVEVIGLWDVEDIAVVGATSCARRTNGRLACWGSNQGGFLGAGETTPLSSVPVDYVGIDEVSDLSMHGVNACVVRRGDVWCWRAGVSTPALVRFP